MNIRSFRNVAIVAVATSGLASISSAQVGWGFCIPGTTTPFSTPYIGNLITSELFSVFLGASGTYTQGGGTTPPPTCWANAITANIAGGIGFAIGTLGSVQSSADDGMQLTYGMPQGAGGSWGYATILQGTTTIAENRFGANAISTSFSGLSDRYVYAESTNDQVKATLRIDLVGDSARLDWTLQNIGTDARSIGLKFGQWVAMLAEGSNPVLSTGGPLGGAAYITAPGYKPIRTERRFTRVNDAAGYPAYMNFALSQPVGYGLRVENTLTDATRDPGSPTDALTESDEIVVGSHFFLMGAEGANPTAFPNFISQEPISDVAVQDNAFIQTYSPTIVAAGSTRKIVQFFRSTWSDALYSKPYAVVVDTPKVLNLDPANSAAFAQNPFTVRVWVDNVRGFATNDQEIPLQDVKVTLLLPDGLSVPNPTKFISRIDARRTGFVDFTVTADPTVSGDLTYQTKVEPSPGPVKTVQGVIKVVSQPRLAVRNSANLVTSPWSFVSPVWDEILGLTSDADFQAFTYDPQQKGYVIQTGPERGRGTWIVSRAERGFITLGGTPTAPTDGAPQFDGSGGAPLVRLKSGWNLIGNPYPSSFQLGQIVGASGADNSTSLTWATLVARGYVSGSLAYWDSTTQTYRFIDALTDRVEAQRGYWLFVNTAEDVVLRFPPIFETFVRSTEQKQTWTQSDKQWRLQLVARNGQTADEGNYVGVASSAAAAKSLRVYEPPMAPVKGAVSLSIEQSIDGQATRLAQSLGDTNAKLEFTMKVESRDAGPVTVTWPNLSTIPKNVRVRLVDVATGDTRDARKNSGYTFQADSRSVREFKLQLEPGTTTRAVIGNVVVTRDGRSNSRSAPVVVNYTLAADASTSIRILGSNGREIYTVTRGRADKAGQNSVTWNLRDNANRAVAPGAYRVEILAEGDGGERVRKFVPITVVR